MRLLILCQPDEVRPLAESFGDRAVVMQTGDSSFERTLVRFRDESDAVAVCAPMCLTFGWRVGVSVMMLKTSRFADYESKLTFEAAQHSSRLSQSRGALSDRGQD